MKSIGFIIIFIVTLNCFGQLDSLITLSKSNNIRDKERAFVGLIGHYRDFNIDSAWVFLKQFESLINQEADIHDSLHQQVRLSYYQQLGSTFLRLEEHDSALHYYNLSLALARQNNNLKAQSSLLNNMGVLYEQISKYDKAISYYYAMLRVCDTLNDKENLSRGYNNIGLILYRDGKYPEALEYYNKSLKLKKEVGDKKGEAMVYNNIGIVYYFLEDYDNVLTSFKKSLKIYQEINDLRSQSLPYYNIGQIYQEQNQYKKSLFYYKKAFEIDKKLHDLSGQAETLTAIASVYMDMSQVFRAIGIYEESVELCRKLDGKRELSEALKLLSSAYEINGQSQNALKTYKEYTAVRDTIFNLRKDKAITEIREKYEAEKKDQQIASLNQQKELDNLRNQKLESELTNQQWIIILSLLVVVLVLFGIILLYRLLRSEKFSNQMLEFKNQAIKRRNIEIGDALEKLNKALKAREMLLANTTHELRTPLNIINGFTNLLFNTELSGGQAYYIEQIKRSNAQLLHLINDLLTASKLESGNLSLVYESVAYSEFIQATIATYQILATEKDISFEANIHKSCPQILKFDPVRIQQIITNLLDNALKFTKEKGIVKLSSRYTKKGFLIIEVEDNGEGIHQEEIDKVFESFYQAKQQQKTHSQGSGLGLNIVKQLVELHNGSIQIKSALNKGTKVIVQIPCETSRKATYSIHKLDKIAKSESFSFGRILLAEDNQLNAELTIDILNFYNPGLIVDIVGNGKDAIDMLQKNKYDLLLIDLRMPVMDGYQVTEIIRNEFPIEKRRIPILAMTAQTRDGTKEKCIEVGMNGFIEKPFEPALLISEIERLANFKEIYLHKESANESLLSKIYASDPDRFSKVIKITQKVIPEHISALNDSVRSKEWEKITYYTGQLRTSLGYLSAEEAISCVDRIESECSSKRNFEQMCKELKKLEERWKEIKQEFDRHIN